MKCFDVPELLISFLLTIYLHKINFCQPLSTEHQPPVLQFTFRLDQLPFYILKSLTRFLACTNEFTSQLHIELQAFPTLILVETTRSLEYTVETTRSLEYTAFYVAQAVGTWSNLAELWMHVRAKFNGGKFINGS